MKYDETSVTAGVMKNLFFHFLKLRLRKGSLRLRRLVLYYLPSDFHMKRKGRKIMYSYCKINRNISVTGNYMPLLTVNPVGIYLLKVNNRNSRTRVEICSKLAINTPE